MSIQTTRQYIKKVKLSSFLTIIVAVLAIGSASFAVVSWIDDRYADQSEVSDNLNDLSTIINKNLTTINDNIILLGNAFYDQRISEIDSLIKEVDAIENKNSTEIQFIQSLRRDLAELKRRQQKLLDTELDAVGDSG